MAYGAKLAIDMIKNGQVLALLLRSLITTALVWVFFELFPHQAVGVSEVHLILGSTLLLMFGVAPAAIGLVGGLLIQGLFFAPQDLPQYGMNVTTLLVPLFVTAALAAAQHPPAHSLCRFELWPSTKIVCPVSRRYRDLGRFLGSLWSRRSGRQSAKHCQLWRCLHERCAARAFGRFGCIGWRQIAAPLARWPAAAATRLPSCRLKTTL